MSKEKSTPRSSSRKRRSKRYEFMPYLKGTSIFVAISMIVAIPVMIVLMNYAVDYVHTAQKAMPMGLNDYSLDNSYEEKTGKDYFDSIKVGKLIGNITCEKAGLNTKVYYGVNRLSLREAAGLDNKSSLPGNDGCAVVAGNATSDFGAVYNVKRGDKLVFDTFWGSFVYKVVDVKNSKDINKLKPNGDSLVLTTASSTDAFAIYGDTKHCVVATLVSKEVR